VRLRWLLLLLLLLLLIRRRHACGGVVRPQAPLRLRPAVPTLCDGRAAGR